MREQGNLPVEVTGFTGRAPELRHGLRLFSEVRLVTVTGPAGVGKTRIALRLADALRRRLPDGAWHVELSGSKGATSAASALALALGRDEVWRGAPAAELVRSLRDWRALVVLDTCDHLREIAADLADLLLRTAPRILVLVTSRRPLGVPGERLITVPPLPLESSLRLFEDRAAAIDPDFALTPLTIQAVTELCRRLDGLPLAIELAAARLRSLSVVELLDRLDDRFGLLAGVSRTALKRHRGLRAALEWSHELCDPRQRRLWARLSVFPGEFGLREAEAVCAGEELPAHTIGPVLADLVEGSIVIRDGARHRLLESFRELGALRLLEYGEADAVRARHRELPTDEGTWPRTPRPVWEGGPGLLMPGISASPLPLPISGTLSHRQREVAELITEGLSNPKIAERLMIAKRTVDAHVRNILVKGGLTSRTQVATWMVADSDLSNDSGSLA